MRHTIKTELLQKVMAYLSSRPFAEVNTLISDVIADAKPVKEEKTDVKKEEI
jgi:hypothetical protein